jgi:hypothetical protein
MAEGLPLAGDLLSRLIGQPITTVTGAVNTVLNVTDTHALVATQRSPGGAPVPIAWVQRGLDLLGRDGEVEIDPDVLDHRSSFVGAVLLTLAGTSVQNSTPPRVLMNTTPTRGWHIRPGDTIRRRELHDRYGGSRQGGTIPSRTTPNVMLFLDRDIGNPHGYFDGWVGAHMYYTGHGQRGDQEFRAGNSAVLRHRDSGMALRLFRGAGGVVRYLGEFELDDAAPYFRMEAPESETGEPRQVIVFRLNPIGEVIHDTQDDLVLPDHVQPAELDGSVAQISGAPVVTEVPIENQFTEEVEVARTSTSHTAFRREQTLVIAYADFLAAKGIEITRFRVRPPGEARELMCDVFDKTRNNLIEAKGTGARGEVRMALGQLIDYGRFVDPPPGQAVLLPARPRSDLEALLLEARVHAVWPAGSGFTDNADGRFT